MSPGKQVSILIPTHNRAELLAQTLDGLAAMDLPRPDEVELIVVANACSDQTEQVVAERVEQMPFATRCVVEPQAGSSVARNRAMAEARGGIFAFLDDDVRVSRDWLTSVLETFDTTPAGHVAGRVKLWWAAVDRPPWFDAAMARLFAEKDHGEQVVELHEPADAVTANYAIRRKVYEDIGGFRVALGRRGKGGGSCEDPDFIGRALQAGHRMFYCPTASVQHWIEPGRLEYSQLVRMARGMERARVMAKASFGPATAVRCLVGHLWLVARYGPLDAWCLLTGRRYAHISTRLLHHNGWGGLNGMVRRLLHGAAI